MLWNIQGGLHILPILKTSAFVLILLTSLLVIALLFFNIVIEDSFEYKQSIEYTDSNSIEIAFFGTSHTRNAINHEFIPGSFNFASSGKNHLLSYYQLKRLLAQGVEIKTLVIEIDTVAFSDHIYKEPFLFPYPNYYTGFYTLEETAIIQEKEYHEVYLEYLFPFVGRGKEFIKSTPKDSFNGFKAGYINFIDKDFVPNERGVNAFLQIVELAEENNIRLILIKQPYLKEHTNNPNDSEFYENLFSKVNAITTKYEFLDYSNIFTSTNYFFDPYHMNSEGSKLFSKQVYNKIKLYK